MFPQEFVNFTSYFYEATSFLQKYSWLHQIPVTHLLTSDVLSKIPHDWIEYLVSLSNEELNNFPLGLLKDGWPDSLKRFLEDCKRFTLPVLIHDKPLYQPNGSDDWLKSVPQEVWRGMSQKKREEVELMSSFVSRESQLLGIDKIVDLGSGLGYVDRLLLLRGFKILGIESQTKLVKFATIQKDNFFPPEIALNLNYINMNISVDLIPKARHYIVNNFFEVNSKSESARRCKMNDKSESAWRCKVNDKRNRYNWERLVTLCQDNRKVCMIGLHACGDLAVTGLKMYLSLPEVTALVLIPCCYHKMAINGGHDTAEDVCSKQRFHNFPLSEALAGACVTVGESFLCRPFLRLASQATNCGWQGWSEKDHQQHSFNVLSRAVVELFVQKENTTFKKCFRRLVTKNSLKDQNFSNYIHESLSRCKIDDQNKLFNIETNWEKIRHQLLDLWEQHQNKLRLAEVLTGLQMCLEPVSESLVVADRICFLQEQGVENVRVIRIIDNKLSPRCLAYVTSKT